MGSTIPGQMDVCCIGKLAGQARERPASKQGSSVLERQTDRDLSSPQFVVVSISLKQAIMFIIASSFLPYLSD